MSNVTKASRGAGKRIARALQALLDEARDRHDRRLGVAEIASDRTKALLHLRQERPHQVGQPHNRRVALVAHPQPEIDRHLIIAAPPRVQPLARIPDDLGQPALHIQVNILQRGGKGELPPLDL
jgi:hypothetical protein